MNDSNKIVLYGGQTHEHAAKTNPGGSTKQFKPMRNCIADICLFDIETEAWSTLHANLGHAYHAQDPVERSPAPVARRNHVAGMLNDHMIIYGGIDNYQKNLNDVVSIDL